MSILYLTGAHDQRVRTIVMIRRVMRLADPDVALSTAQDAHRDFERNGYVALISGPHELCLAGFKILEAAGMSALIDPAPETLESLRPSPPEDPPPASAPSGTPEKVAIALLAQSEGSPLVAAANALVLARATANDDYLAVVRVLIEVFPWVAETLRANGLWHE